MPRLVSSLMRSGWRGVLMLTALVALLLGVVGLALGVGTSDDQTTSVTALAAAQTLTTAVAAVAQPSATTVGAVAMSPAASSQTGATTTSFPGAAAVAEPPPTTPVVDVDVVVYALPRLRDWPPCGNWLWSAPHLRVALISSGNLLETPLAQGLRVEDARDIGRVAGGFYREWRKTVIDSYATRHQALQRRRPLRLRARGGRPDSVVVRQRPRTGATSCSTRLISWRPATRAISASSTSGSRGRACCVSTRATSSTPAWKAIWPGCWAPTTGSGVTRPCTTTWPDPSRLSERGQWVRDRSPAVLAAAHAQGIHQGECSSHRQSSCIPTTTPRTYAAMGTFARRTWTPSGAVGR